MNVPGVAEWNLASFRSFFTESVLIQLGVIGGLIAIAFVATSLTRRRIHPLAEDPEASPLLRKGWTAMERMVAPLFLLLLCLLTVVFFYKFYQPKQDLIRPFTSVAGAWAILRLISGFIKSRAWLRLVAGLAFGVATLHIFGALEKTIGILDAFSFNLGETRISALDFFNGVAILLGLLWLSTLLAGAGESRIRQLPNLPPSLQVLLGKILRAALIFLSFLVALSTVGLDLSSRHLPHMAGVSPSPYGR